MSKYLNPFGTTHDGLFDFTENDTLWETTSDSFMLTMKMPGLKKEDIKVSTSNGCLNISYDVSTTSKEKLIQNKLNRRWEMPSDACLDALAAKYENGILKVTIRRSATSNQVKNFPVV